MAEMSRYIQNHLHDAVFRGATFPATPANVYFALIVATAGQSPRSTAITAGQTTIPAATNGHSYRCTTAGTTGSAEPVWPTGVGATVTDGTVVWIEQTPDYQAAANITEVSGGGYARVQVPTGPTYWAATNSPTSTVYPSTGTTGITTNLNPISFPQSTANQGLVIAVLIFDASTGGNLLYFALLTTPQSTPAQVTNSLAAGAFVLPLP